MKLLRCHVHNFGVLHDVDYIFDKNPFVIMEDNGKGKTTLLNFILAMIYGLDTIKARNKEEVLRELYCPYNGGLFGGSLEIEKNGKTYRIEKSFDNKSSTKDETKTFINNKETSFDPIKDIVGLDESSFLKTLYYRNNDFDLSTPDSLTNSIIKLDSASSMASNYIKAVATLEKIEKNYSKNSDAGIIKGLENKIKEDESKKLELSYSKENDLDKKNKAISLEEELQVLNKELKTISSYEVIRTKNEYKVQSEMKLIGYENDNKAILTKYNNELLIVEDISSLREINTAYRQYLSDIHNSKLTEEEEASFLDLDYLFKKYPLDDASLEEIKNKENRLIQLEEKEHNLNDELSVEERVIYELFEDKELTDKDLEKIDEHLENYQDAFNHVSNASSFTNEKKDNKLFIFLIVISLLLLGGGITLFFFVLIAGIILTSLGVLSVITTIYFSSKNKGNNDNSYLIKENNRLKDEEDKLREFTVKYAIYSPNIINDVNTLKNKYENYLSIKEKMSSTAQEKENIVNERNTIKKELETLKNHYMVSEDVYNSLSLKYHKYVELKNKISEVQTKISLLKEQIDSLKETFIVIKNKYKLDLELEDKDYVAKIDSYKEDLQKYNHNLGEIEYWKKELNKYNEDTSDIDTTTLRNKDEVEEEIKAKQEQLAILKTEIKEIEDIKNECDILDKQISINKEKLLKAKKEDAIYKATINALNETNNTIISKYIDPIKNDFVKYASYIEELIGQSVNLKSNFELEFKQGDSLRSYNHLSLGEKTIAGMVLRMSFISQLFKEDRPFILLDDPFTDLDQNHLSKSIKFIKEMAKDMQIIYITCHPSRLIK